MIEQHPPSQPSQPSRPSPTTADEEMIVEQDEDVQEPPPTKRVKRAAAASDAPVKIRYRARNFYKNNWAGTMITYSLSEILHKLSNLPLVNAITHKILYLDKTKIHVLPSTNMLELFGPDNFAANFSACWNGAAMNVFTAASFKSTRIPGVSIQVDNDLPKQDIGTSRLNNISAGEFRKLLCLLTSYYYGIDLPMCECFPKNSIEYLLFERGLGKNCYSIDCKSYLESNMYSYEPLVHGNCDSLNQTAIVMVNNFILDGEVDANILQTLQTEIHGNNDKKN